MKIYQLSKKDFYSIKKHLDQMVFWRTKDENTVEVRPVFKYAKQIIETLIKSKK